MTFLQRLIMIAAILLGAGFIWSYGVGWLFIVLAISIVAAGVGEVLSPAGKQDELSR